MITNDEQFDKVSETLTALNEFIRLEAIAFRTSGIDMPITFYLLDNPIKQSNALFEEFIAYARVKAEESD